MAPTLLEPDLLDHYADVAVQDAPAETATAVIEAPQTAEGDLLARFAEGDNLAFDRLVTMHQEAGFWAAVRVVNDEDTARDVVQDAFMRVMLNRRRYDPRRPFRAWFLRIVRNLAIDHLRRHKHEYQDFDMPREVQHNAAENVERNETRTRISDVLGTLPAKYHDLLVMREIKHMRADTIAERIGVDYTTTRWRIHQARKLFRAEWVARYGSEDID